MRSARYLHTFRVAEGTHPACPWLCHGGQLPQNCEGLQSPQAQGEQLTAGQPPRQADTHSRSNSPWLPFAGPCAAHWGLALTHGPPSCSGLSLSINQTLAMKSQVGTVPASPWFCYEPCASLLGTCFCNLTVLFLMRSLEAEHALPPRL